MVIVADAISEGDRLSAAEGGRWYVVQTQPRNEMRAVGNLVRQNFRVFCPSFRKTVRHARKVSCVPAPLFPNYVFVQMACEQVRWRAINGTFGVSRILMQNDLPQPVPSGVVETLLAHAGRDGAIDLRTNFRIGQRVQLLDGPFTDLIGELERLDARGRVHVLFSLMGRKVSVATEVGKLMPVA